MQIQKKEEREDKVRGGVSKRDEISLEMQCFVLWFWFLFLLFFYIITDFSGIAVLSRD